MSETTTTAEEPAAVDSAAMQAGLQHQQLEEADDARRQRQLAGQAAQDRVQEEELAAETAGPSLDLDLEIEL